MIVEQLVKAMIASMDEIESKEEKITFLQSLIETDPPEDMINFTAALDGTTPELIITETRKLAIAELEKLAS